MSKNLKIAFATHLHSDHTLGLPDLIFSLTPGAHRASATLRSARPARNGRSHRESLARRYRDAPPRRRAVELDWLQSRGAFDPARREIYRDANVTVTALRVAHGSFQEAYGYRFDAAGRSIVISGDTTPTDAIVKACNGCDVLIHEVYSESGFARRPPEWQQYHARFHTSSKQLGEIATRAHPGILVLYHQLFWGTSEADLLDEAPQRGRKKLRRKSRQRARSLMCTDILGAYGSGSVTRASR